MADNVTDILFRFINDKQSTNALLRDNARIDDSLEAIDDSVEKVTDSYSDMERAAKRTAKANRDVAEASIRSAKEQSELVGDVASRTGQLSGSLSGLGAVGGQRLMIVTDILDAAEAAQLLSAEFPAMISQLSLMRGQLLLLGAAGGAIAATILILKLYNDKKAEEKQRLEEAQAATTNYVNTLLDLNKLLVTGSAEDIEQARQTAEDNLTALRNTRQDVTDEMAEIRTSIEEQLADIAPDLPEGEFDELVDFLLMVEDGIDIDPAQIEAMANFTAEYGDASIRAAEQLEFLNNELKRFDTDIQAAEENLGTFDEKVGDFNENAPKTSLAFEALDGAIFNAGSAGRKAVSVFSDMAENAEVLQAEMDAYNKILEDQEADALAAAAALFNLDQELENVGTSFETIEKGAQAIADAEAERAKVIADTEQAILDVTIEGATKRAELITNTEREIADLQNDFTQDAADDERDYRETIGEITRDFQQDNLRDLQDFQREQRRAEEDHRDNLLDAVGRLDAVGILNEQRNFEKDQKRAKEDFDTEQKRRNKEFKLRLKDEDKAFKRARQQAERSYRERERDLRDSLNRQLSDLRTAQNREIAELRGTQAQRLAEINSALEAELRALTDFTVAENTVRDEHYVEMLDQLQTFVDEANVIAAGLDPGGAVGAPAAIPNTPGAVGQFPLSAGLRSPTGIASPFASPMAMLPPVSRSASPVTNAPQINASFVMPDHITPGMARNLAKIVIGTLQAELV